jgi:predicted transcriptional regulator
MFKRIDLTKPGLSLFIGNAELAVLDALNNHILSAREIHSRLSYDYHYSISTVNTVIKRLIEQGVILHCDTVNNAALYRAAMTLDQITEYTLTMLVDRLYDAGFAAILDKAIAINDAKRLTR